MVDAYDYRTGGLSTDTATTTFGPLGKYVAANDNKVGATVHNPKAASIRGIYVAQQPARTEDDPGYREFGRLANEQGVQHGDPSKAPWAPENRGIPFDELKKAHNFWWQDNGGQFHGDNPHMEKTPEERLPGALKLLADQPGYVYLGSPYSKYEAGHAAAARVAADAAAYLMRRGLVIYSPIAHGHAVAAHGLPLDWGFWKAQCQPLIDAAAALIVLTMDGWQESVGLQYEIDEFVRTGRPILHVSPRWLAENEVGRAAA